MRPWAKTALIGLGVVAAAAGGFAAATVLNTEEVLNTKDESPDICIAVNETVFLPGRAAAFISRFEAAFPGHRIVRESQFADAHDALDVLAASYRDLADQAEDLRGTYLVRKDNPVPLETLSANLRVWAAWFDVLAAYYESYSFRARNLSRLPPPMAPSEYDLALADARLDDYRDYQDLYDAVDYEYFEVLLRQCGF